MLLSAALQNAQSLIDLFWVGRLGPDAVAALALSGVVLGALYPIQMGLATGTVALVARACGEGECRRAATIAAHSISLGIILGFILCAIALPLLAPFCRMLGAEAPVVTAAVDYLRICMYSMSVNMVLYLASSSLQAAGNTTLPMLALLCANVLNMVLDPLLIFGFGRLPALGVAGAAWATMLANSIAALGLVYILFKGNTLLRVRWPDFKPHWPDALRILRIGVPSMAQMTARSMMGLVIFRVIARFGTIVVAAYGICMRWHMVMLMSCFVLGNASATMVGQNLGARQARRARRAAWTSVAIILIIMALSTLPLYTLSDLAVAVFNSAPEVVAVGSQILRIITPFYLLIGVSIVLDRSLNGAGCTVATMIFTITTLWGVQVPLALLLPRWFDPPVHGVWWAMNITNSIAVCLSVIWFLRGRWMHKQL